MTFREMMELYKEGSLDDAKKMKLEGEIEKHEAISEYLYENEQIPSVAEILGKPEGDDPAAKGESIADKKAAMEQKSAQQAQDFAKMIRSEMKKMMIKTGAVVLAIILVAVILVTLVIPKIVDNFYYKPDNKDFTTYASLFLPDSHFNRSGSESGHYKQTDHGWGIYDIEFTKWEQSLNDCYSDSLKCFTIHIDKNTMTGDDNGFFTGRSYYPIYDKYSGVHYDAEANMKKKLAAVTDNEIYDAYLTFTEPVKADDFKALLKKTGLYGDAHLWDGLWIAVCANNSDHYYSPTLIGMDYTEDNGYDPTEAFVSNVRHYASNDQFILMMEGISPYDDFSVSVYKDNYNGFADDIEQNGMYIYGMYVPSVKGEFIKEIYENNKNVIDYICFEQ